MRNSIIILVSICFSILSCSKSGPDIVDTYDYITFYPYVQEVDGASTKALVEDENYIIENELPVIINDISTSPVFNNTSIDLSDKGLWVSEEKWVKNKEYTFYGYIQSEGTAGTLDVSRQGQEVALTQPATYSTDETVWCDYLLSYKVTPDAYTTIVGLQFERITSAIEVYISKAREDQVTLTNITVSDITNEMQYVLLDHKFADRSQTGYRNIWQQNPGVGGKVSYSRTDVGGLTRFVSGDDRFDEKFRIMKIVTVPQKMTGKLSIAYTVVENGTPSDYVAEYDLSALPVSDLKVGHKIRYYIKIDTSADVEVVVSPWKEVDFVEGTFLPK